jgi:uncharacterized protein (TIGR03089 family)
VEALFTTPERAAAAAAWTSGDRYATGLLPFAAGLRELPPGFADYTVEVRGFGDRFVPAAPVDPRDRALAGPVEESHTSVCQTAAERATELGIKPGDRVLVDARTYPDPADWLLAPLIAGASIVLCGNLDPVKVTDRAGSERVTLLLT